MQFEEFDNRIKEAADHHHPAYDEQAWAKMEKLLNKHMPVKKDRRRGIIFFLLFLGLLMGGASYLYFSGKRDGSYAVKETKGSSTQNMKSGVVSPESAANSQQSSSANATADESATHNPEPATTIVNATSGNTKTNETLTQHPQPATNTASSIRLANTNDNITSIDPPVPAQKAGNGKVNADLMKRAYARAADNAFNQKLKQAKQSGVFSQESVVNRQQSNSGNATADNPVANSQQPAANTPTPKTRNQQSAAANATAENPAASNQPPAANNPAPKTQNLTSAAAATVTATSKKKHAKSTFFITASGGPDVSVVGVSNTGSVKLVGGAGLGYTFRNKFTLRTGFYTARKVYTASPDQYHPPAAFWNYYPNLQKVEADCKVYEIPLLFSFNFANKSNSNWFAGTGISSYLMKKETYNYFYKTMAGVNTSRKYTLLDKNHHYFSVLTLSAGYSRSLGHGLTVSAEPYLKVPLSGIGYGKINLNSAGVLFSAGWAPFHPKKAKPAAH